jgi:hypothetical protein
MHFPTAFKSEKLVLKDRSVWGAKMSILVQVNRVRDSGLFHAGDEVSGTVEMKGPLPFPYYDDSKVNLTFTGSSETCHVPKGGALFKDNAIFFQYEKVFLEGVLDFKSGASQTWQFSFQLPEQTEPEGAQIKINRKKRHEPTWVTTPHPIPQSTALSGPRPYPWQGLVSYTLHAKVSGKWGWREDRRIINVVPKPRVTPSDAIIQRKEFTHSSSRLLAAEAENKRSMNKWFRDKFSSSTPTVKFEIKIMVLQTLTPDKIIPIVLRLNYDIENSTLDAASLPELRLLDMRFEIWAKTELWGDDHFSTATSRELAGRFAPKDPVYRRELKYDSHFLVNNQTIEVNNYKGDDGTMYKINFDRFLVSPFRTYNLARSYEARVVFSFECGGKKMKAKFEWPQDIAFAKGHLPPTQLDSNSDDSANAKMVGKMAFHGIVTIVTTALGV